MFQVKAIIPAKRLDARQVASAIQAGYRRAAEDAVKQFQATAASWKHQPKVEIITDADGIPSVIVVGDVFHFVDAGTRPHTITPKAGGFLRFRVGFTPKTTPGSMDSGSGGSFGPFVAARRVEHPGTKPRHFSKTIKERADDALADHVRRELSRALS